MRTRITFIAAVVLLFMPILALAQGDDVEPTSMEYIALMFNVGIVGAAVQLLKWKLLPILKKQAPYAIPLIGMGIGTASAWVMKITGVDISPIGNIFEVGIMSGAFASSGFAVLKEVSNKVRPPVSVLFVPLLFFAIGTEPATAQELDLKNLSAGGGSIFAEEDETFDASALFGAVQWRGVKLPLNTSTGIGVEFSAELDAEGERGLICRMWNLVRVKISERLYAGTDTKFVENRKTDFDSRIVTGILLGTIGGNELVLEIYSLDENKPIYFAAFYRF